MGLLDRFESIRRFLVHCHGHMRIPIRGDRVRGVPRKIGDNLRWPSLAQEKGWELVRGNVPQELVRVGWSVAVNLTEGARRQGIHPHTAYRWFEGGTLPAPAERVGPRTILVNIGTVGALPTVGLGLYARVSWHDQRFDLERQAARLTEWAAQAGRLGVRVESEVGSVMNGQRSRLRRLLSVPEVATVVVEHRDRPARMNAELVEASLLAKARRLVVLDWGEVEGDLVSELVEVLTSFCAHLNGQRSAGNRALKALDCAKHDVGPKALSQPQARVNS